MAASVVLIIYCCPFVLWAKPMHRIRMTAEMVAVTLWNLPMSLGFSGVISEAIDPTYRVND